MSFGVGECRHSWLIQSFRAGSWPLARGVISLHARKRTKILRNTVLHVMAECIRNDIYCKRVRYCALVCVTRCKLTTAFHADVFLQDPAPKCLQTSVEHRYYGQESFTYFLHVVMKYSILVPWPSRTAPTEIENCSHHLNLDSN